MTMYQRPECEILPYTAVALCTLSDPFAQKPDETPRVPVH